MTSWHTYPKVWSFGHAAVKELLFDPVIVEEKIDGSQFSFGVFDGQVKCRSKGKEIDLDNPEKMFIRAVDTVFHLVKNEMLTNGWTYRCEYLATPNHNVHKYNRVPHRHLILFDVNNGEESYLSYDEKVQTALLMGLEVVPCFFQGMIEDMPTLLNLLETESVLGGQKVEGIVVKNYHRFGADKKVLMAKHVREDFKEKHKDVWKEGNPGQGDILNSLRLKYTSQARWQKALQHLRENGQITDSPRDIGLMVPEIKKDTLEECADEIRDDLFKWAWPQIERSLVKGFPDWYKNELLKKQFESAS